MKKFNNLSFYRGLAAISILVFHLYFCFSNNSDIINLLSKQVQGLTALSGFLYANKVIKSKYKFYRKNFIKIIRPALLILILTLFSTTMLYLINGGSITDYWFNRTKYNSLLFIYGNFWYIPIILICYLITPLLNKTKDKNILAIILLIIILIIEEYLGYKIGGFPITIIAYVIGYYLGSNKDVYNSLTSDCPNYRYILITLLLLIITLITYFNVNDVLNNNIGRYIANLASSLYGVLSFILISLLFKFLNKIKVLDNLFKISDSISYPFYLFNQLFMSGGFIILINDNIHISFIFILLATTLASFLISKLDLIISNKYKGSY